MSEISHTGTISNSLERTIATEAETAAAEAVIAAAAPAPPSVPIHDTTTTNTFAAHHANIDTLSNQAQLDTPNLSPKAATLLPAHLDHTGDDDDHHHHHHSPHDAMPYLHQPIPTTTTTNNHTSSQQQERHHDNHSKDGSDDGALVTPTSATTTSSTTAHENEAPLPTAAKDLHHNAPTTQDHEPPLSNLSTPSMPPSATFADAEYLDDSNSESQTSSTSASPLRVSIPPKLTSTLPLAKRKSRIDPESKVGRRLAMMAQGRNENGQDLDTTDSSSASNQTGSSHQPTTTVEDDMADLPDGSEYPDSFWEELLRQDQTTISRSATTMPKKSATFAHPKTPTSAPITTVPWRSTSFVNPLTGAPTTPTMAHHLPPTSPSSSAVASRQTSYASLSTKPSLDTVVNGGSSTPTTPGEEGYPLLLQQDPQMMDLKVLQLELLRTKDGKVKAEEDAKTQRDAVRSLKTEVQFVRNVLKRRETELGDVKEMSNAYETELSGLRKKLEQAERQLAKGNGELEAKIRALERLRDESFERIKVLDEQLKTLKTRLADLEKKHTEAEAENKVMKQELEELEPLREELERRKEAAAQLEAQESAKILELTAQIQELEDTRDCQAAQMEELEAKLKTVETEAQEFKSKAELEYEALSEGFKEIKTRRSEEIKALRVEIEQHKLQEQIIEKLQADIDQLQEALTTIASSHSSENARLNQVTAELNEALAEKDHEVQSVRLHLTEFEDSHNRLVASLHETLDTIREEAEAARKSRDEAVAALESLREELETLRHTLPINQKHMSLSEWSEEHHQNLLRQQQQVIQDLESKVHGQVDGVKEGQQRADALEANTKRKSQQLVEILEQHLQLSSALVSSQSAAEAAAAVAAQTKSSSSPDNTTTTTSTPLPPLERPLASIPVRAMLNYLTQLRAIALEGKTLDQQQQEASQAQQSQDDESTAKIEEHLRAFLATLDDEALMAPWVREKALESEIKQLQAKIEALLAQESAALSEKSKQLASKELLLKEREDFVAAKEQEIQRWEKHQGRRGSNNSNSSSNAEDQGNGSGIGIGIGTGAIPIQQRAPVRYPATPPLSAGGSPVGSPATTDLLSGLMAAHRDHPPHMLSSDSASSEQGDSDSEALAKTTTDPEDKATQQERLIAALQAKIAQLEAQALGPQQKGKEQQKEKEEDEEAKVAKEDDSTRQENQDEKGIDKQETMAKGGSSDEEEVPAAFPSPPPQRRTLHRAGSIPRLSVAPEGSGWRASTYLSGMEVESFSSPNGGMLNGAGGVNGGSSSSSAANQAKMELLETELAAMRDENQDLLDRLEAIEAELELARRQPAELEEQLQLVTETAEQQEEEMEELRAQQQQQSTTLDRLQEEIIEAENQIRGLTGLKQQLEQQVQQERRAKDDAIRAQEHLRQQLEEEMQKKKGGFLCF